MDKVYFLGPPHSSTAACLQCNAYTGSVLPQIITVKPNTSNQGFRQPAVLVVLITASFEYTRPVKKMGKKILKKIKNCRFFLTIGLKKSSPIFNNWAKKLFLGCKWGKNENERIASKIVHTYFFYTPSLPNPA